MNNISISQVTQNQDGTIAGGFVSITNGRYRVVLTGSDSAINNINCPCGADTGGCGPEINIQFCTNGKECLSASQVRTETGAQAVYALHVNDINCGNCDGCPPTGGGVNNLRCTNSSLCATIA